MVGNANETDVVSEKVSLSAQPAFCAEIPRPGFAVYERHPSSGPWFEVYRIGEDLYAIAEPYQWEEVISYLIVGEDRALLFDSGNGIGDIKSIVDQLATLPVTALASHSHFDHVGGHSQFDDVLAPDTDFTNMRERGLDNTIVREEVSPEALLKKAKISLTRTSILAPFDGRVLSTSVDLGQVVSNNAVLGEIYATDAVEARLPIKNDDLTLLDLSEDYRNRERAPDSLTAERVGPGDQLVVSPLG